MCHNGKQKDNIKEKLVFTVLIHTMKIMRHKCARFLVAKSINLVEKNASYRFWNPSDPHMSRMPKGQQTQTENLCPTFSLRKIVMMENKKKIF